MYPENCTYPNFICFENVCRSLCRLQFTSRFKAVCPGLKLVCGVCTCSLLLGPSDGLHTGQFAFTGSKQELACSVTSQIDLDCFCQQHGSALRNLMACLTAVCVVHVYRWIHLAVSLHCSTTAEKMNKTTNCKTFLCLCFLVPSSSYASVTEVTLNFLKFIYGIIQQVQLCLVSLTHGNKRSSIFLSVLYYVYCIL